MAVDHPGKSPAQKKALDAIGCGNFSPSMSIATRDKLVADGLIIPAGVRVIKVNGPFPVRVMEYAMPTAVHMQWCKAMADEFDRLPEKERRKIMAPD